MANVNYVEVPGWVCANCIVRHGAKTRLVWQRLLVEGNPNEDYWWLDTKCRTCGGTSFMQDAPPKEKKDEAVDHPTHYGGNTTYEAIKVIHAWGLNFCLGNAAKYICRFGKKKWPNSSLDDLKKARWYLDYEITRLQNENNLANVGPDKANEPG